MQPAVDFSPLRRAAGARALSVRQAEHDAEVTTLLEAAYRLIRRRGVVEPGVREVVAEAGLANRAFYPDTSLRRTNSGWCLSKTSKPGWLPKCEQP